jgi:flagellar basal-body rod modification protein FlgD
MTTVSTLSTNAASTTATSSSRASLGSNFQTFLTLLTTQIQNQDPLSPMDSNQFTEQLVQFSQVEQQIKTNEQMESLVSATRSSQTAGAISYIGRTAQITSNRTALNASGGANWDVSFPAAATTATARVQDSAGRVVLERTMTDRSGNTTFEWDGKNSLGRAVAAGVYRLSITATDAEGATITPTISVNETINGVSFDSKGSPEFVTAGGTRTFDSIRSIR